MYIFGSVFILLALCGLENIQNAIDTNEVYRPNRPKCLLVFLFSRILGSLFVLGFFTFVESGAVCEMFPSTSLDTKT